MNKSVKIILLIVINLFLTSGCYSKQKTESKMIYQTSFLYLHNDVSNIDFGNLEKSKYNDLIYKNILIKFLIIDSFPKDIPDYNLTNLDDNMANSLCLASVFVEYYQPLDIDSLKFLDEPRISLIELRPAIFRKLNASEISNYSKPCGDDRQIEELVYDVNPVDMNLGDIRYAA